MLEPDDCESWSKLANAFLKLGRYKECVNSANHQVDLSKKQLNSKGVSAFEKIHLNARLFETLLIRGDAQRFLGQLDKSLADYSEAVKLKPTDVDGYVKRESLYEKLGNEKLAQEDKKTIESPAVKLESNYRQKILRGNYYNSEENYETSIQEYCEASRFKPDGIEALFFLALKLTRTGKFKAANSFYGKLLVLAPHDALFTACRNDLAIATKLLHGNDGTDITKLWSEEQRQSAIRLGHLKDESLKPLAMLTRFVSIYPGDIRGYRALAEYHSVHGNFPDMVTQLNKMLVVCPHDLWATEHRVQAYKGMHEWQKAIDDLDWYLTSASKFLGHAILIGDREEQLFSRADCYFKLAEYEKAAGDYTRILKFEPDSEDAYKFRADCSCKIGKYDLAVADYTSAIELDPDQPTTLLMRAQAYEKLGKSALAAKDRAEAAKRKTPDPSKEIK